MSEQDQAPKPGRGPSQDADENKLIDDSKGIRKQVCSNIGKCLVQHFSAILHILRRRSSVSICALTTNNHTGFIPSPSHGCSSAMIIPFHFSLLLPHCQVKNGHHTTNSKENSHKGTCLKYHAKFHRILASFANSSRNVLAFFVPEHSRNQVPDDANNYHRFKCAGQRQGRGVCCS